MPGVALRRWAGFGGVLGRAWARLVAGDAAVLCVAGVALGDIHRCFTWQAWHLVTSTLVSHGRRGTWRHRPSLRVAGVALGDMRGRSGTCGNDPTLSHTHTHTIFHRQLCHATLSHTTLCRRRGSCGTGLALVARLGVLGRAWARLVAGDTAVLCVEAWHLATSTVASRGRRGTW